MTNPAVALDACTCVACGCDDDHACPNGCAWHFQSAVYPDLGVCTTCAWEFIGSDLEEIVAQYVADWASQSGELAADRAAACDLIVPGDTEFDYLRGRLI